MHVNAFAFLSLHGLAAAATARLQPRQAQGTKPVIACASLKAPAVPGATVVSINATEVHNFELPAGGGLAGVPSAPARENGTATGLSFCDVNVTLTHGNDSVRIEVWLPLENWNGRFQGTGGGGFIAGTFASALAPEVASGYAAASTDAGLRPMSFDGSTIKFDQQLLKNFASLSVHEMAVVGKNLTAAFYGKAPDFSYWNGCSTGGRQGYMEAQRFPDDFDGILAVAPAINWARFVPAEMWPFVLQNSQRDFMPTCVMNAMVAKHVAACDKDDGAEDNVISDPQSCRFDVSTLVGVEVGCNGTTRKVTEQQVDVYKNILAGPTAENGTQLWFGFLPGTNPSALSRQQPFSLASGWINNLVAKSNVAQSVTMTNFSDLFASSEVQFGTILNTDSPDLTAFRNAGGKLLTWQGLSDQLIPPQGTINYRQKVEAMVGDAAAADSFYRLFFAPGVAHCAGGSGAQPVGVLDTLVNWVEKGMAPETLSAKTANSTRNICKYPLTSRYRGSGDVSRAESWDCVAAGTSQSEANPGRSGSSSESSQSNAGSVRGADARLALAVVLGMLVWSGM